MRPRRAARQRVRHAESRAPLHTSRHAWLKTLCAACAAAGGFELIGELVDELTADMPGVWKVSAGSDSFWDLTPLLSGSTRAYGVIVRVLRSDRFGGLPAEVARQVMRWFSSPKPEYILREVAEGDGRSEAEIAAALAHGGWLELAHTGGDGTLWWKSTVSGGALSQASFRRPITRATAERHVREVVERARAFNDDPGHLAEIVELVVFGSFLDPDVEALGDVDLAVSLRVKRPRGASRDDFTRSVLDYADASGRSFGSFVDRLHWPQNEAILVLKNRSPVISITTEDVQSLTDRRQVIYQIDAGHESRKRDAKS